LSNTIQTSINAVQGALGYWNPTVGTNSEPAISAANMTQQVILSPPFKWPWNRNSLTFNTVTSPITQDYTQSVTDFGYAEIGSFQYPSSGKIWPLTMLNNTALGESIDQQQPVTLAVQLNTVGTSVKFRFLGVPDKIYSVVVWYQKFVALMTTTSSAWTAPDYMSYIYNRGFLAHLYEAKGDPRAQQEKIAFAAALLATAEGLTESEKNIFLMQYLSTPRAMELLQLKTQQGVQARGM
jgi:hypothetical protein